LCLKVNFTWFFSEIFRFSIIFMLGNLSLGVAISPRIYGVNRIVGEAISELHIDSTANQNINFANR
jgi:hypothetical protein